MSPKPHPSLFSLPVDIYGPIQSEGASFNASFNSRNKRTYKPYGLAVMSSSSISNCCFFGRRQKLIESNNDCAIMLMSRLSF